MSSFPHAHPAGRRFALSSTALAAILALVAIAAPNAAAADAGGCPAEVSNPFLPWNDDNLYRLAPDGDFETGADGWSLADGAAPADGASPLGGASVLSIPAGGSALSAPICVDGSEPFAKVLTAGAGGPGDGARVAVAVIGSNGTTESAGTLRAHSEWGLSRKLRVPDPIAELDSFQYRFTALDGDAVLDSLYVDPHLKH